MDFIELYENALDVNYCDAFVLQFEQSQEAVRGATGGGVDIGLKNSWDIMISSNAAWRDVEVMLNNSMVRCLAKYLRTYPFAILGPLALKMNEPDGAQTHLTADSVRNLPDAQLFGLVAKTLRPGPINLQKYVADQGGYPRWHCELYPKAGDFSGETLHRLLFWTLYLNDNFEAGETEFFHQRRAIAPRKGALVIAPAGFTHTHRGTTPRNGDKYIATSWVLFQRAEAIYASSRTQN
jgi:hypothetical protein